MNRFTLAVVLGAAAILISVSPAAARRRSLRSSAPTLTATATALPTATPVVLAPVVPAPPTIALGAVTGASVAVVDSGLALPYEGYNVSLAASASPGVVLAGITGTNGTLFPDAWCWTSALVYACTTIPSAPVSDTGLLASISVRASGDGCVRLRLRDLAPGAPDVALLDTYTIGRVGSGTSQYAVPMDNAVDTGAADVLVGAGSAKDCAGL